MEEVIVYNVLGQQLVSEKVNTSNNLVQINTEKMVAGVYQLHVQTNKGLVIRKFEILK